MHFIGLPRQEPRCDFFSLQSWGIAAENRMEQFSEARITGQMTVDLPQITVREARQAVPVPRVELGEMLTQRLGVEPVNGDPGGGPGPRHTCLRLGHYLCDEDDFDNRAQSALDSFQCKIQLGVAQDVIAVE
ncbi:hypothetical protein DRA43_09565 [Micromonospora provocatoris]|nr:hypothetical protein DRA43_09565 [Micromonospora provocatoris]